MWIERETQVRDKTTELPCGARIIEGVEQLVVLPRELSLAREEMPSTSR